MKITYSKNQERRGYTLIEILVAMSVFSIMISIVAGGLTQALRTQRQAAALLAANSNLSLSIEQMAREIRTGYDFCVSTVNVCDSTHLIFRNYRDSYITYAFNNKRIERAELSQDVVPQTIDLEPLTADNVTIDSLSFLAIPDLPARVTMVVRILPQDPTLQNNPIYIQTTVSARPI